MPLSRTFRHAAVAAAACALLTGGVQAAPLNADGQSFRSAAAQAESPAGREHRAGIQAQLNGDVPAARRHFEAALKIDARHVPALVGLAAVAQAEGRRDEIERHLRDAERADPNSPLLHLAWGRHLVASGQFQRAEQSLVKARDLAPNALPPLLELGDLYLRSPAKRADAVRSFGAAVKLQPGNARAQYGLGVASAAAGRRDEALAALARAAELAPRDPAPHRAIGRLQLEAGAAEPALAAFDEALRRAPGFVPPMLDRVDALAALGRLPDAVTQLQAAERAAPQSPEVQLKFGDVHQTAQRWAEAEPRYLKTIELAPGNPLAYNNLAWMTVARGGDAARAVELARKAVELSPRSSPFHDTLGWAQRAAGDLAGAEASLRRAIELEPGVAGYHYHLGVVLADTKRAGPARAALQRSLELARQGPQADEARRLLASLPPG
ncbi:MAG: tetratricopeptide repeat protein [Rubrivivax sp.]|nr:tetratricopeptide repeat protein [Rubrivivax sp.]